MKHSLNVAFFHKTSCNVSSILSLNLLFQIEQFSLFDGTGSDANGAMEVVPIAYSGLSLQRLRL